MNTAALGMVADCGLVSCFLLKELAVWWQTGSPAPLFVSYWAPHMALCWFVRTQICVKVNTGHSASCVICHHGLCIREFSVNILQGQPPRVSSAIQHSSSLWNKSVNTLWTEMGQRSCLEIHSKTLVKPTLAWSDCVWGTDPRAEGAVVKSGPAWGRISGPWSSPASQLLTLTDQWAEVGMALQMLVLPPEMVLQSALPSTAKCCSSIMDPCSPHDEAFWMLVSWNIIKDILHQNHACWRLRL